LVISYNFPLNNIFCSEAEPDIQQLNVKLEVKQQLPTNYSWKGWTSKERLWKEWMFKDQMLRDWLSNDWIVD
jgi:hypothetical protein